MSCSISAISCVSNLSKLVGVTTTTDSNGALNVFVGNGQPLVLAGRHDHLDDRPQSVQCLATRGLDVDVQRKLDQQLDHLRGSRRACWRRAAQVINPALNQLGQIATALPKAPTRSRAPAST